MTISRRVFASQVQAKQNKRREVTPRTGSKDDRGEDERKRREKSAREAALRAKKGRGEGARGWNECQKDGRVRPEYQTLNKLHYHHSK